MKASFDGTGEVLLITGGANGIGAALAAAAARAGSTVVVFDIDIKDCPLAGTPGIQLVEVDVTDRVGVWTAVDEIVDRYCRIDGLVAAAVVGPRIPVLDTDATQWTSAFEVNLHGVVWTCQAVMPHMVQARRGSVIVFTSGLALTGYPSAAAYSASKAAVIGFAKSLAAEVAEHRVRVNVVSPGVIDTPQFRAANRDADLDHWRHTTGVGDPDDVVGPLLFLLSDAAGMTGSTLTRERAFPRLATF